MAANAVAGKKIRRAERPVGVQVPPPAPKNPAVCRPLERQSPDGGGAKKLITEYCTRLFTHELHTFVDVPV